MIRRLLVPLFLASLAASFSPRKSLAFGPHIPHALFNTAPHFTPPPDDPATLAVDWVSHLLASQLSLDNSFVVRDDSYTDQNTGVSHIYIKQIINGLEVADGDINLNVFNGQVLSYGTSVSSFHTLF
jgi:extracellular elastinolytic metalloproteinase